MWWLGRVKGRRSKVAGLLKAESGERKAGDGRRRRFPFWVFGWEAGKRFDVSWRRASGCAFSVGFPEGSGGSGGSRWDLSLVTCHLLPVVAAVGRSPTVAGNFL